METVSNCQGATHALMQDKGKRASHTTVKESKLPPATPTLSQCDEPNFSHL